MAIRVPPAWYTACMRSPKPRIQVTLDSELAAAVAELGGAKPRSRAVHDLALRGAQAIRSEQNERQHAIEFLRALDSGEDDGYDFAVSERLHASR
jgi:Arc/MetJ family transcription regulator